MKRYAPQPLWSLALAATLSLLLTGPVGAASLPGDLNGDGQVDSADEALLVGLYGSAVGGANFDPAADLNADGSIDALDLALFGAGFGATGGDPDTTPPGLFVSLEHVPDAMNDVLVVPLDGFQITLDFDSAGGSITDVTSLVVTSSEDVGPHLAGTDLSPQFTITPTAAVWQLPPGTNLEPISHYLSVAISDVANNEATDDSFGFAVRDFVAGPPLGNLQTLFLDFDQDRSGGVDIDFLEDLREYGLSSDATAQSQVLEPLMRFWVVTEVLARVHPYYGRAPNGDPGPDAVNIVFVKTEPLSGPYSVLCVGGESVQGGSFLGAATLDENNLEEASDQCGVSPLFGVFPQAIDNLWGADPGYHAVFDPVDPDEGGVPAGEHALDPVILDTGFDPSGATPGQLARLAEITTAVERFAQIVASASAHETGHYLGLTAPGLAPMGLFGGGSGPESDHNVTASGTGTPTENFLMNQGGSFTFAKMSGHGGVALPIFRALNWAYLRDRVAPNRRVTGLYDPPILYAVEPNPATIPADFTNATITICGANFFQDSGSSTPDPSIELLGSLGNFQPSNVFVDTPDPLDCDSTPVPDPPLVIRASINAFNVLPGSYDVRIENPDAQSVTLVNGLVIQ